MYVCTIYIFNQCLFSPNLKVVCIYAPMSLKYLRLNSPNTNSTSNSAGWIANEMFVLNFIPWAFVWHILYNTHTHTQRQSGHFFYTQARHTIWCSPTGLIFVESKSIFRIYPSLWLFYIVYVVHFVQTVNVNAQSLTAQPHWYYPLA